MRFTVEIAGPPDALAMAELHHLSHTVSFASFASEQWISSREKGEYRDRWVEFLTHAETDTRSQAWKVAAEEMVVGMVKVGPMDGSEAQLSSMHVHPDYQRRGIGSLLMNAAIEFIHTAGFERAILGVIQANEPARAVYERNGWNVQELHPTGVEGVPIAVYGIDIEKA